MKILILLYAVLSSAMAFANVKAAGKGPVQISLLIQGRFGVSRYDVVEIHSSGQVQVNGVSLSKTKIKTVQKELQQVQVPPNREVLRCPAGVFQYELVNHEGTLKRSGCPEGMNFAKVFMTFEKLKQAARTGQ